MKGKKTYSTYYLNACSYPKGYLLICTILKVGKTDHEIPIHHKKALGPMQRVHALRLISKELN